MTPIKTLLNIKRGIKMAGSITGLVGRESIARWILEKGLILMEDVKSTVEWRVMKGNVH